MENIELCDGKHYIRVVQHKTREGITCQLREETVKAIKATFPPKRELIFEWPHTPSIFYRHWNNLVYEAGLEVNRRNGPQKLRRTSASHLEAASPGTATAHLGHRSADLARKHYLDPNITQQKRPIPPSLD
jgi:hypothetical protein